MQPHHICTMDPLYKSKETIKNNFFLTWFYISHKNPRTKMYFRSMASIEREQERQQSLKLTFVIHPLSMFRLYYEGIFAVISYITLIIIPLHVMISPFSTMKEHKHNLAYAELISDIMHIVDFVLNFFTGRNIPLTMNYTLKPREISRLYVKTYTFYYDLLMTYPNYIVTNLLLYFFPSFAHNNIYGYITLASSLSIIRLKQFIKYYKTSTEPLRRLLYLTSCIKYLLLIMLSLHWLTCYYCVVVTFYDSYINKEDVIIPSLGDKTPTFFHLTYYSMYYQALLIVVSYLLGIKLEASYRASRFLQADLLVQRLLFIVYSILGYIMCHIFFVIIMQMILSMNSSETKYYSIISQLKTYMTFKDLPNEMRDRILTYYEYRFRQRYFTENTINDMLSATLRKEIYFHTCQKLIENVPVLKDLPTDIISEVVANLKYEVFLYNDLIIKAGVPGNSMYFIANGTVAVLTPTGKEICHLQDGAYFGEIALVTQDRKRVSNVVAIEICEVYRLNRCAFKSCFPVSSPHYRKFEQIAMERLEKTKLLEELHKKYMMERHVTRLMSHYGEND